MQEKDTELLTSWKEIADRLDVTVRTAQEWEKKRGLPVRRLPGPRGRVFMRVSELEAWLEAGEVAALSKPSSSTESNDVSRSVSEPAFLAPSRLGLAAAVGFLAVMALLALATLWRADVSGPAQWQLTENEIVVSDEDGEELWRATLDTPIAPDKYKQGSRHEPRFEDLDGDGYRETLLIARRAKSNAVNPLICFDAEGNELWRFVPGRDVRSATEPFENIYRVDQAVPVRLSSGDMGIVTVSVHYKYYPTQITLLSARDGTTLAEYWHAGYIGNDDKALEIADYDEDGRSELYLAGISNSHRQATLVVLDLEAMAGASAEEDPEYQLLGFDPPNEIARLLFPRSSMSLASGMFNAAVSVWLTPEFINVSTLERFHETLPPELTYHVRPDWTLDHMGTSSTFQAVHERLWREGAVPVGYDDEIEGLGPLEYIGDPRPLVKVR